MSKLPQATVKQYALALGATLTALLTRLALDPFLGDHLPYVTCFASVAITTYYADLGASLTAVVLSGLASSWFFMSPRQSLAFPSVLQQVGFTTYLIVSLTLVGFGQAWRRTRQRAEATMDHLRREVDKRRLGETALRESEARKRAIFESALDCLITMDADGRVRDFNPAAERTFGYTQQEAVGRTVAELIIPPLLWEAHWVGFRRFLQTGQATVLGQRIEMPALRADGTEILVELSISVTREPDQPPFFTAYLRDITERARSEQALAHLAAIVMSSDDAILSKDLHGIVTSWNSGAERLFGYEADEMIGQPITRLIPPDRQDEEPRILERIAQGERIDHYETIRRRKDGTDLDISLTISPLFDAGGKVIGASKIARDITQDKRTQEALRRNERNLSDFFDNASIGLNWVGPDGIILRANQTELDMLGYSREEYVGRHIAEFHVDQPVIQDILERLTCGETLHEYPAKLRCKDGSIRDVLMNSNVLSEDGKFIHARCFTRDITDAKRALEALTASREELRRTVEFQEAVVSNMGEGLYTVDGQGLVTFVNTAAGKMFGWTRDELVGRKMHELTHYKHRDGTPFPAEECAGLQVLRLGKTLANHEDVFIRKDGSFFDVVYSSSPIRTGETITGLVVVFRDVSETKRAEVALQDRDRALTAANDTLLKQTKALAEANKELEGFSYSVSHDLRAPLRTIDAFSRIVEEDHGSHLNDDARRCLAVVRNAAAQAGELIDDLLEFSRLGRQGMDFRSVKMTDLAREKADEELRRSITDDRKIEVIVADLPSCRGDRRLLNLVWSNLLSNAFKYTKYQQAARIEVGWLPDDAQTGAVVYYVKDNGVGFDMKYLHKLFDVFQRLHKKEEFDGTGVGLAIVQRIVHRHGGRVWAQGKVDGGATFYFSLQKAEI